MSQEFHSPVLERLRTAAQLHTLGLEIKRHNLRRQHAEASEAEIERLLGAWLRDRPMD
jgi:hypothetical protein